MLNQAFICPSRPFWDSPYPSQLIWKWDRSWTWSVGQTSRCCYDRVVWGSFTFWIWTRSPSYLSFFCTSPDSSVFAGRWPPLFWRCGGRLSTSVRCLSGISLKKFGVTSASTSSPERGPSSWLLQTLAEMNCGKICPLNKSAKLNSMAKCPYFSEPQASISLFIPQVHHRPYCKNRYIFTLGSPPSSSWPFGGRTAIFWCMGR